MKPALCPVCGSALEVMRSSSEPSLSCPTCHWYFGSSQTSRLQNEGAAPAPFLGELPSLEIGQDIFGPLLTVPKPRPLRWNWRMKAAAILMALIIGIAIWMLLGHLDRERIDTAGPIFILACWATALISLPLIPELSNRKLLTEGEVALGRVVYQQTVQPGKDSWSAIFYAFADGRNRGFVGRGQDYSDSLAQGAPVVVFYDPLNPNKNLAMECSRFSVKTA